MANKEMKTLNGYEIVDAQARKSVGELSKENANLTERVESLEQNGTGGGTGADGKDGISPIATVTQTDTGAIISIQDENGTTTATILHGKDGANGKDGVDGKDGTNGKDGADGRDGQDGYTPVKGVDYFDGEKGEQGVQGEQGIQGEKGDKGDKGDTGATGSAGKDGANGTSCTHSWNGTTLIVTSASGTSSADLKGEKGDKGDAGANGADGADGSDYVLTEADKQEIAEILEKNVELSLSLGIASDGLIYLFVDGSPVGTGIPQGQSGDVFGYVDENNNIVLTGNLADGTYSIKYEMEDGSTVDIGDMVLDNNVYYSVTSKLTNCTNGNSDTQAVDGGSYSATITANDGYEISSITVTMGGNDITSSAVSGGIISIASVTGNIVITAVATETVVAPAYTNLLPLSIDADGNDYVGTNGEDGYKSGYRIRSSTGLEEEKSGVYCSGFMTFNGNSSSTIRVKNIKKNTANTSYNMLVFYSDLSTLGYATAVTAYITDDGAFSFTPSAYTTSADFGNPVYFRFCCGEISDETIVTVDEEIV